MQQKQKIYEGVLVMFEELKTEEEEAFSGGQTSTGNGINLKIDADDATSNANVLGNFLFIDANLYD
ncbi:MAG: hypothetical protein RMY16_12990 [Nostoc sp. DedQUE12b]|uniref:hypothetical protein n=1 Tax=Nostoc sp. DedQUE12b TaxID=3075398 RepID=UPI002AD4C28C|nr:hypothetical protein [Nostoc sp. DedQUE12b]MDZ8086454.1 hypothetical protein [Nostoc sp. DedQUE12b]